MADGAVSELQDTDQTRWELKFDRPAGEFVAELSLVASFHIEFKMSNHFENEINAFVDCIKTGSKLPSHIDTNVITASIMQAIYDSSDSHREVVL